MYRKCRSKSRQAIFVFAALLLGGSIVSAQRLDRPSIEEMARVSDLVVVVKVLKNKAQWVDRKIVTTSKVQKIETYKGETRKRIIDVSFLGGTLGVINQHVTHEATLQEGEIVVLFLAEPTGKTNIYMGGMRIVSEWGKITLLQPGESDSRFDNNRRLKQFLEEIRKRVQGVTP